MGDLHTLESLHKRLALLEDINALHTLMSRYSNSSDNHDWDGFADCFVPNGVLGVGDWGDIVGRENIKQAASAENAYQGLYHSISNLNFIVHGNTATGTGYLHFVATMDLQKPHGSFSRGARYKFEYQRTDDGWRIQSMHSDNIWSQGIDPHGLFK
ncbi:hypothetical protein GGI35DRAFT_433839 [Trichoderma velutinum]